MIVSPSALQDIAAGRVTLVFRRWEQLRIKPGSRIRSARGVIEIGSVDEVDELDAISVDDAIAAGFASPAELTAQVDKKSRGGSLYRIGVRFVGEDPRRALRERADLDEQERSEIRERLARLDGRRPWTRTYLELIAANPGVVARQLAPSVGMERDPFKIKVRRLKDLGLTESLDVGYRLSPRGRAFLDAEEG